MIEIGDKSVVVNVSGGGQSAVALARCLEWYGKERVTAVFADTNTEAPDLYDFLIAIETLFGIEIDRLNDGRNIWDVFDQHKAITLRRSGGACKASVELKQKPLRRYHEQFGSDSIVIALGLCWTEPDRQARHVERQKPFECIFPLNEQPRLSYCGILEELERLGLPKPEAYEKGYPHNNCGGGCVLAGVRQWQGLLVDYPDRFAWHEERERQWQKATGQQFTVLRDRRGGQVSPYTLTQFREDIENGRGIQGEFRSGCGCMLLGERQLQLFTLDSV